VCFASGRPCHCLAALSTCGRISGAATCGTTTIDVIAHIGPDNLELDRLVLSRFEGSQPVANAAFKSLVERYGGRPSAEYALAPREIDLS
jgi:hypothetical protein